MTTEARELVKEGTVTAVITERHACRVEFADKDGLISAELPVLTNWAYENKMYHLPDVGETVVCLFASNADNTGTGWIIGSRFHDKAQPNANSQDVARTDFSDGTFIEYDRSTHELKINCVGDIIIKGKMIYLN